jgi:hypothetical protein
MEFDGTVGAGHTQKVVSGIALGLDPGAERTLGPCRLGDPATGPVVEAYRGTVMGGGTAVDVHLYFAYDFRRRGKACVFYVMGFGQGFRDYSVPFAAMVLTL